MKNLFDISNTVFTILGYSISYVEFIGTLFGLVSVFFASRANILTWPTGIVNELFLFILFFQVQLYADMFLQIFFLAATIYGWAQWKQKSTEHKITNTSAVNNKLIGLIILFASLVTGYVLSNIHLYCPAYFKIPAAYPYIDSFIMVVSIIATMLLAKMKMENWYLWIAVDVVCTILYYKKGIYFLSIEYLVFLGLAFYGLYNWKKEIEHD